MVIIKTKILDILNRIGVSDTAIEELSDVVGADIAEKLLSYLKEM